MSSSISSPITIMNTNVGSESIPTSPITSKHHVDKPVIILSTTDTPTQETKEDVSYESGGCAKACKSIFIQSKRILEIFTYFRLVIAIALYVLIVIDLISIKHKKEKKLWIEILTQASC
jgi:hypothetical protein